MDSDKESFSDDEESFRAPVRSLRKKYAVIDTDSEDDISSKTSNDGSSDDIVEKSDEEKASSMCSNKSINDDSNIEDSFNEEHASTSSVDTSEKSTAGQLSDSVSSKSSKSNSSPTGKKSIKKSTEPLSAQLQLSLDDFIDFTDDEDNKITNQNMAKKFVKTNMYTEDSEEEIDVNSVDKKLDATSFKNNTYRDTTQNSSDEEDQKSGEINDSTDEEQELLPNKGVQNKSLEVIDNCHSIVEVTSSDEEVFHTPILKQTDMKSFLSSEETQKEPSPGPSKVTKEETIPIQVGKREYENQARTVESLEAELLRTRNALRVIKLENLPDKGESLVNKEKALNVQVQEQRKKLNNMTVDDSKPVMIIQNKLEVAWDQIEAGVDAVGPRTFGKIGVARFNAERQLAVETLDELHASLETRPGENDIVEDPKGLRCVLMPHQRRGIAWLLWREKQKPSGGLLADDMGLGKTLTMISLVLKSREMYPDEDAEKENYRNKYAGGTLIVCPASLMNQWSGEIERRTKRGLLSVEVYHGPKRETKPKRLAQHDLVITTYALVQSENDRGGAIFGVRWRRIILDEAHQIRNHKSRTAEAVFKLSGKSRWALTGTPVHNKELDMYAILKFLRCSPFDDLQVWKHWVGNKSSGGEMRLHAVISSLMLRRTKAELMEKGALQNLPDRKWELITIKLEKDEMNVYQKVLIFSRTLFAQFLHQRAEKNQDAYDMKFNGAALDPNAEYFKMRNKLLKLNRVKEVSQHEILVLLLRLRQICCHPSLIKQMLQGDEDLGDNEDSDDVEAMNLLDQLNNLNINDEDDNPANGLDNEKMGLKEASKGFLNPQNPVFRPERPSSKIKALIKILKEKVATGDKAIVVSQWTSLLSLVASHIKDEGVRFDQLNGKIPVHKRMEIVDNFNNPKSGITVLLLSLTAGGVGLNLVGANHLFLLDLHWNPQLESQAQDRIYRMGQTKNIFVYKLMAEDTIEERIKLLQDHKLDVANSLLTGSKRVIDSKLSLQDLKMLFDFK